jgi:hypothetical protein
MVLVMKLYRATVWIRDEPGVRVSIHAESLDDASQRLQAEYGNDAVERRGSWPTSLTPPS